MFAVPASVHAAYGLRQIPYGFKRWVLRQDVKPENLYEWDVEGGVEGGVEGDVEGERKKAEIVQQEKVSDRV